MVEPPTEINTWRYENKFIIPYDFQKEIYHQLAMHPARFSEVYEQRYVNNIYLDELDRHFYHENSDGIANRKKIRVRWYGHLYGKNTARLEMKIKKLFFHAIIPDLFKQSLDCLELVLLNRYARRYFLSLDKKFRITIDDNITYYRMDNIGNLREGFKTKDPDMILELKYDKEHANSADQISNFFPFRVTKNSKYMKGLEFTRF